MANGSRTTGEEGARVSVWGKHMFIFFMDRAGMVLQHRVPEGKTVNADYYSKVITIS